MELAAEWAAERRGIGERNNVKHFIKSDIVSVGAGVEYVIGADKENSKKETEDFIAGSHGGMADPFMLSKARPIVRHAYFRGTPVDVELDVGMEAEGVDPDGVPWHVTYKYPYGEIPQTEGEDKDPVDVYLGPCPDSNLVFVVHQVTKEGKFDEDKVFLGFDNAIEATRCYFEHGPKWGFGSLDTMLYDQFLRGYLASNRPQGFKQPEVGLHVR